MMMIMNGVVHGKVSANLTVCTAIKNCRWDGRGPLHRLLDCGEVPAYLSRLPDTMDEQGFVHLSQQPDLGDDINIDHIAAHSVAAY